MPFDDKAYAFKQFIEKLKSIRGSGTELISVYVPVGSQIADTTNRLKNEYGQASNIKSKSTRKNVMEAIDKILNFLKMFRVPPPNGLVVFCGNISQNESKVDVELFSTEPPFPINIGTYRCDSGFFLEPIEGMLDAKDSYGVISMDGKEATLAIVRGTDIKIVRKLNSTAHSKIRKGGQSANRFARIIEESIELYYKRIGEAMDRYYIGEGGSKVKGILVGGPGPAKHDFLKMKPFNYQHQIIGCVDTGYTDEYGVREVLAKSDDLILDLELNEQRKYVDRFLREVSTDGLATYGYREVLEAIEKNKANMVMISEATTLMLNTITCGSCNNVDLRASPDLIESAKCSKCGAETRAIESKKLADAIVEKAREKEIEIRFISDATGEGQQFLRGFHGLGAFLKYK